MLQALQELAPRVGFSMLAPLLAGIFSILFYFLCIFFCAFFLCSFVFTFSGCVPKEKRGTHHFFILVSKYEKGGAGIKSFNCGTS